MKEVTIDNQKWPVRFDFSAIKRILPMFGYDSLKDANDMLVRMSQMDIPLDAVTPMVRAVVRSGLMAAKDERECPTIEFFDQAIDEDLQLVANVIIAMSDAPDEDDQPQKATPGKPKKRITKR
jgi:hypothetical protein